LKEKPAAKNGEADGVFKHPKMPKLLAFSTISPMVIAPSSCHAEKLLLPAIAEKLYLRAEVAGQTSVSIQYGCANTTGDNH